MAHQHPRETALDNTTQLYKDLATEFNKKLVKLGYDPGNYAILDIFKYKGRTDKYFIYCKALNSGFVGNYLLYYDVKETLTYKSIW